MDVVDGVVVRAEAEAVDEVGDVMEESTGEGPGACNILIFLFNSSKMSVLSRGMFFNLAMYG